jgi:hypothetical protein
VDNRRVVQQRVIDWRALALEGDLASPFEGEAAR